MTLGTYAESLKQSSYFYLNNNSREELIFFAKIKKMTAMKPIIAYNLITWKAIVEKHGIENISKYASFKRFIEVYSGDEVFRKEFSYGDLSRLNKINVDIDFSILNDLITFTLNKPKEKEAEVLTSFRQYMLDCSQNRVHSIKHNISTEYELWRLAQYNRGNFIFNKHTNKQIVHAPLAVELTKGCTVGCWFCGISADSFDGASLFGSNQELYVHILNSIKELAGDLNQLSFLYWATDPLDNPDYENYLTTFAKVFDYFPQTTTAQGPKYIERIRRIINLTNNDSYCTVNRLSILSKAGLYKVFKEFTPFELATTLLVMQQPSSVTKKADAGRASSEYINNLKEKEEKIDVDQSYQQSTIACVSGFKVNLVTKKIQLMSPTISSEKYPDGFIVYGEKDLSLDYSPINFFHDYIRSLSEAKLVISHGIKFRPDPNKCFEAKLESNMTILHISGKLDFEIFQKLELDLYTFSELSSELVALGHSSFYISNKLDHYILQGIISYDSI